MSSTIVKTQESSKEKLEQRSKIRAINKSSEMPKRVQEKGSQSRVEWSGKVESFALAEQADISTINRHLLPRRGLIVAGNKTLLPRRGSRKF
jgi:hypothetical protein